MGDFFCGVLALVEALRGDAAAAAAAGAKREPRPLPGLLLPPVLRGLLLLLLRCECYCYHLHYYCCCCGLSSSYVA
jgi:hypothetical protein